MKTQQEVVRIALEKEIERRASALEYCKGGSEAKEVSRSAREEYAALAQENEDAISKLRNALNEL